MKTYKTNTLSSKHEIIKSIICIDDKQKAIDIFELEKSKSWGKIGLVAHVEVLEIDKNGNCECLKSFSNGK